MQEITQRQASMRFQDWLQARLEERNLKPSHFARELSTLLVKKGLKPAYPGDVGRWLNGASPNTDKLFAIYEFFGSTPQDAVSAREEEAAYGERQAHVMGVVTDREVLQQTACGVSSSPKDWLEKSPLWAFTTGDVSLYHSTRDRKPFRTGTEIFTRLPLPGVTPPPGTFVILQSEDQVLLARTADPGSRLFINQHNGLVVRGMVLEVVIGYRRPMMAEDEG